MIRNKNTEISEMPHTTAIAFWAEFPIVMPEPNSALDMRLTSFAF